MHLTNMMLSSLDGQIASFPGQSDQMRSGLTFYHQKDRQLLEDEIANSDMVIVGGNTARTSGGIIDVSPKTNPIWAIASSRPLYDEDFLFSKNVIKHRFSSAHVVSDILNFAKERGFEKLLLLGGSQINQLFYDAKAVHTLKLTLAPLICAAQKGVSFVRSLGEPVPLVLKHVEQDESHLFLTYDIKS